VQQAEPDYVRCLKACKCSLHDFTYCQKQEKNGMSEFKNVSIVIAAINETYSLRQTVEQILALCNREDWQRF